MLRVIQIGKQERGFLYKLRSFHRYLKPGTYFILDPLWRLQLYRVSTATPELNFFDAPVVLKNSEVQKDLKVLDIQDNQRGLLFVDGRFRQILGPGEYGFFQDFYKVEVEMIEVTQPDFEHKKLELILSRGRWTDHIQTCHVRENHIALMLHNGKYIKTLEPGTHAFWKNMGDLQFLMVCTGEQQFDVAGQEMMTKDKVTLRMNVHCTYKIKDPIQTELKANSSRDVLYREIQLVIRQEVASRKLDELLSERESLSEAFLKGIVKRASDLGYEIKNLGLRDIILPGEMKNILNQVVEAEKKAQANLIKRREETAATRSLLNTAKLMDNNPILMQLKEFEVLSEIAHKVEGIQVVGNLGAIFNQVKFKGNSNETEKISQSDSKMKDAP